MILCPSCSEDLDLDLDDLDEGDIVTCAECGDDFEIVTIEPIQLASVDNDDDDDDYDYESDEDDEE